MNRRSGRTGEGTMRRLFLVFPLAALLLSSGCRRLKDFDVSSNFVFDPNGFPLNPKWGKQVKDGTLPDVFSVCPGRVDPSKWYDNPSYPNCTSIHVTSNPSICGQSAHINFITVTYEGKATWNGHAFVDDDYEIDVRRDNDSALYNTASSGRVHTEFDSEETVDNWDDTNTWWDHFHHAGVDHVTCVPCVGGGDCVGGLRCFADSRDGDGAAGRMLDPSLSVTVIGLLGLDFEHNGKTELHPVYAMFVEQPTQDPRQTSWSYFVRNWGNQGSCGDDQQNLFTPQNRIRFRIPNALALLSHNEWVGSQNGGDLDHDTDLTIQPLGNDILLIFRLLPPDKQSWFVGDITFSKRGGVVVNERKGTSATPGNKTKSEATGHAEFVPFPDLQAQLDKLPQSALIELRQQLQSLVPSRKSYRKYPIVLNQQAQVDRLAYKSPGTVLGVTDPTARLNRLRRVELIKTYLASHKIK